MRLCTLVLTFFFSIVCLNAQSTLSDGYINYSVSVDSDEPAAAFLTMGSSLEIAFKGKRTKAVAKVAGGTNTISIVADHQAKAGLSLMDVLGEKKALKVDKTKFEQAQNDMKQITTNPMRLTEDVKNIAGYACRKLLMKDKESGANIILYITDKIKPMGDPFAQLLIGQIKGFPLGIVVRKDGTTVRVMAEKVSSRTPSDAAFELTIPSGYQLTTLDDLEDAAKEEIKKNR